MCEGLGSYLSLLPASDAVAEALRCAVTPFVAILQEAVSSSRSVESAHAVKACLGALAALLGPISIPTSLVNPVAPFIAAVRRIVLFPPPLVISWDSLCSCGQG